MSERAQQHRPAARAPADDHHAATRGPRHDRLIQLAAALNPKSRAAPAKTASAETAPNHAGLPDPLTSGVEASPGAEALSGVALNDVRPQRRSPPVFQLGGGNKNKHKRKPDRHGQKEAALKKQDLTYFEDRPPPREAESEAEPEVSTEHVPKKTIAREFTQGLVRLGLNPFLSGGAALNWQGGKRTVSDLDFRISTEDAGFTSFDEPKGKAVLTAINEEILVQSRQAHSELRGGEVNIFAPVGGGALTIGTANWFGVECSLSITRSTPKNLKTLPNNVRALSVEDIQADKLKAMITRTKRGDDSVKKVANDLFDFLDATRLIDQSRGADADRSDHADPEIRGLLDQLAAQQPRKSAARRGVDRAPKPLSIADHVAIAARARADEYRIANLEDEDMSSKDDDAIVERMQARAVLTARAHGKQTPDGAKLKGGPRGRAFGEVARKTGSSLASLGELSAIPIGSADKSDLRPWMTEWNQGPDFGPRKRNRLKPRSTAESADVPRPAEDLLALWPDGAQDNDTFKDWRRKNMVDCINIIKILVLDNGFRPLPDSNNSIDTLLAFGIRKNKFSPAYALLSKGGYVTGKPDGLHLTDFGKKQFRLNAPRRPRG